MYKVITIRCKGGAEAEYQERQLAALDRQEELDKQLEAIDLEYYEMRQENKRLYDKQFRPMEESLLRRAALPAREATSAEARASEYAAADEASEEALRRRNERMGISNASTEARPDDEYIKAIALTAVGNASKMSALETQGNLQQAAMGIGTGVNQDIGRTFGRSISGMQMGLGHADAAFQNYANAQGHMNQAYAAREAGRSALMQSGMSAMGMGISNYQNASYMAALQGGGAEAGWGSAFTGAPSGQGGWASDAWNWGASKFHTRGVSQGPSNYGGGGDWQG